MRLSKLSVLGRTSYKQRSSALLVLLMCAAFLLFPGVGISGSCQSPEHGVKRDSALFLALLDQCGDAKTAAAQGIIGYLYRHGYGVHRDLGLARRYFSEGAQQCDEVAWCGLKGLSREMELPACEVSCDALSHSTVALNAEQKRRDRDEANLIADVVDQLLQSDPRLRRDADRLRSLLLEALAPLESRYEELHQSICNGHVRRAITAVGLGAAAEVAETKRQLLIARYQKKLKQGPNARAMRSLDNLENQSRSGRADRQVFFEKYADALLSGAQCTDEALAAAYEAFRFDIRESRVTDVEQAAFVLLQEHLKSVKSGSGARSDWFTDLSALVN